MNILVTGFEPFNNETTNPSFEAVKLLPEQIGNARIIKEEIPVSFASAGSVLINAMETHRPDIVICVGQAGGYSGLALERVAINLQDASIPDNTGAAPVDRPVIPDGPAAYFSTLPVKAMVQALRDHGIPAFLSNSAGTYVCNTLMYTLLHQISSKNLPVQGGFIHVPYSPEQTACKTALPPSMELSRIARGLELAIGVML